MWDDKLGAESVIHLFPYSIIYWAPYMWEALCQAWGYKHKGDLAMNFCWMSSKELELYVEENCIFQERRNL